MRAKTRPLTPLTAAVASVGERIRLSRWSSNFASRSALPPTKTSTSPQSTNEPNTTAVAGLSIRKKRRKCLATTVTTKPSHRKTIIS